MTFIITVVALLIERFFDWGHLRAWGWFSRYLQWLSGKVLRWSSYLALVVSIIPLVVVIGLINCALAGWLYGIFKLLFGIAILLYCLGPDNLWAQVYACLGDFHKADPSVAIQRVQQFFKVVASDHPQQFHQAFTRAIFLEANQRIFAVVFWFVILGPAGAVLYRLTELCYTKGEVLGFSSNALRIKQILDWIPVRLFAFFCALGGHFKKVFTIWLGEVLRGPQANENLLSDSGVAALDLTTDQQLPEDGSAEKESLALIDRVLVIGLVVLAMVTLIIL